MRTYAYVDAFNLYYGSLRGTPYKWLDLVKFLELSFPQNQIVHVRYFTARVKPRHSDPKQPARQAAIIRALQTHANLTVHLAAR